MRTRGADKVLGTCHLLQYHKLVIQGGDLSRRTKIFVVWARIQLIGRRKKMESARWSRRKWLLRASVSTARWSHGTSSQRGRALETATARHASYAHNASTLTSCVIHHPMATTIATNTRAYCGECQCLRAGSIKVSVHVFGTVLSSTCKSWLPGQWALPGVQQGLRWLEMLAVNAFNELVDGGDGTGLQTLHFQRS